MKKEITKQLRRDEGVVEHAYQDHLGWWTIGVGRLIDKRKGGRLTDDEIDYLLANDIAEKERELEASVSFYKRLDEARKGVLLNMAFNLGVQGLLGFRNTLKLIETGKYEEASKEMLNSKWAKQVGARANRLSKQMLTGEWQ